MAKMDRAAKVGLTVFALVGLASIALYCGYVRPNRPPKPTFQPRPRLRSHYQPQGLGERVSSYSGFGDLERKFGADLRYEPSTKV
jgi:hypothetical protein